MSRYIDAELAKAEFTGNFREEYPTSLIKAIIDDVPTADVEKVRHGMWVHTGDYDNHFRPIYICSVCNEEVADSNIHVNKYCLYCGAKMDKEKE